MYWMLVSKFSGGCRWIGTRSQVLDKMLHVIEPASVWEALAMFLEHTFMPGHRALDRTRLQMFLNMTCGDDDLTDATRLLSPEKERYDAEVEDFLRQCVDVLANTCNAEVDWRPNQTVPEDYYAL